MSESNIPQNSPYVQETQVGKYAWCSCGQSQKQPFCDGSHKDTEFKPIVVEITEKKNIAWCGCKNSNNQPYCDGSHTKL